MLCVGHPDELNEKDIKDKKMSHSSTVNLDDHTGSVSSKLDREELQKKELDKSCAMLKEHQDMQTCNGDEQNLLTNMNADSQETAGNTVITKEMIKEEEELHKESEIEEKILRKEVLRQQNDQDAKEQCFKRLIHLLNRSKFYAEFLLTKMQAQEDEEKAKREKKALSHQRGLNMNHTNERNNQKNGVCHDENTELPPSPSNKERRRGRKKKAEIRLLDYVNKEEVLKTHNLYCKVEKPAFTSNASVPENKSHVDRHPLLFVGTMRPYQLDGFEWLTMLYENGINGILADEMGLGKTIQCIALLVHLIQMGVSGPFLVSAPLTTLPNWIYEFHRFAPQVPVMLYHGNQIERSAKRDEIKRKKFILGTGTFTCPIVITSFEITMKDRRHLEMFEWKYIIVDEGHRIKNHRCRLVRELKEYRSVNRLLLTGTPLQNNLAELWSLLNFLLPEIFDDLKVFELWFDVEDFAAEEGNAQIIAQEQQKHIISKMHEILTPFLLRRTKNDVALNLPPKKELIVYAPLTTLQETFYKATLDKTIFELIQKRQGKQNLPSPEILTGKRKRRRVSYKEFFYDGNENKYLRHDDDKSKKVSEQNDDFASPLLPQVTLLKAETSVKLNNIVMQLRKVCNHPYLVEYPLDPVTENYLISEDLVKTSGKMLVLDSLLAPLKQRKHKVLLFSQMVRMLDILQDYCNMRNFKFSRLDGSMKFGDRQEEIRTFNEDKEVFIFLLSTRAGGLGINLTAADTVIIFDSDWNPQSDLQAQDRCHRIGQTKPVVVYRLVTADSFDQKIVERATAKRKLEKIIMQKGRFSKGCPVSKDDKITPEELMELLKAPEFKSVIRTQKDSVFTSAELEMLLDRSDMESSINGPKRPDVPNELKGVFKVIDMESTVPVQSDNCQNTL